MHQILLHTDRRLKSARGPIGSFWFRQLKPHFTVSSLSNSAVIQLEKMSSQVNKVELIGKGIYDVDFTSLILRNSVLV